MDDADRASEEQEAHLAELLRRRRETGRFYEPEGACLNCEALLPEGVGRFCDFDCSADWQHRQEVTRRQMRGG